MKNIFTTFTTLAMLTLPCSVWSAQECSASFSQTAPNTRYAYSDEGTVQDLKTGLTWMRCPIGMVWDKTSTSCTGETEALTWQNALVTAQTIRNENGNHPLYNFAGKTNWRLANIKELVSLTESACHSPAMNATAFASGYIREAGDHEAYIWSNTPNGNGSEVLAFDTFSAEVLNYSDLSYGFSVLLVSDE